MSEPTPLQIVNQALARCARDVDRLKRSIHIIHRPTYVRYGVDALADKFFLELFAVADRISQSNGQYTPAMERRVRIAFKIASILRLVLQVAVLEAM
ncbi:hypothetical protein NLJ89_g11296 [Agrocybe chaxingu]|uniref:Uncharacterized protein n=1 Tax=Agrocybe chaxingu TaxID=84603 RepID=A0A9W8JQ78_9AGAR|nr:hypothetical protein NLJ89_g11296 [Agrocybe chaxingu]